MTSLQRVANAGPEGMRRIGPKGLLADIARLRDRGLVEDCGCSRVRVTGEGLDALAAERRNTR